MAEQKEEKKEVAKKEIPISFPENLRGGVYCNLIQIKNTREEFVMDFMFIMQPAGSITARVIMSPGHMKRTATVLQGSLQKYEQQFGPITEAKEPEKGRMGFM